MTLKEFIENLNEFVKENPETLDMQVITSKDDEGNGFNLVHYTPSKGGYDKTRDFNLKRIKNFLNNSLNTIRKKELKSMIGDDYNKIINKDFKNLF